MVPLAALWLPIVLSAVLVFVASALIWMALPHHRADYAPLPDEDAVTALLRQQGVAEGMYVFPHATAGAEMSSPEHRAKLEAGPVGFLHVVQRVSMAPQLVQVFVYYVVVGIFLAYVASRTLPAGTEYLAVFRLVGTVAFLTYAGAHAVYAIFWGLRWPVFWKNALDALVYALLTAGVFGWLWPGP